MYELTMTYLIVGAVFMAWIALAMTREHEVHWVGAALTVVFFVTCWPLVIWRVRTMKKGRG